METQEQQSQQSQQPQQQSTTAEAMGSHDDDIHASSASSDVEATMREMAQAQRKRQAELHRQAPTWSTQYQHHRRCGQCDDCMKGLPCLVASVDAEQPGAFTVTSSLTTARVHRVEFHGSGNTLNTVGTGGPGPHQNSYSSLTSIGESHSQRRPSSPLATAAVAAVVVTTGSNTTEEEQEQRELELAQHEAQLAQREAQLRAWQADLERQRQELTAEQEQYQAQQQQRFSERTTATTRPSTSVVVAVPEETIERNELGPGPMRFAPNNSMRSSQAQVMGLDRNMLMALQEVEQKWNQRQLKLARHGSNGAVFQLSPQWHMRFLWFYAKPAAAAVTKRRRNSTAVLMASDDGTSATSCSHQVNMKKVWAAEKKLQKRFVTLNVATLGPQLYSKTLFPVPGLKTKDGHSMFYMRPSRYFPKHTSTKTIIDNLVYVMNCMLENSQHAQQHGIGFIACMDSWKMVNFDISYCYAFMMALQGVMVPVKTQLFLIVNPPSWFGAIWKLMKPMLVPSFQRKVKIVPESKIHKYLAPGYEQYLPDDMQTGKANTDAMVVDFVAYRQYVEQGQAVEYHTLNHHQQHYHFETSTVGGESSTGDGDGTEVSYEEDPYYYRHDACHSSEGPSEHTDSSLHDSIGNLTGAMSIPTVTSSSGYDMCEDDDENASIHCDIDNEDELDEADMKPASSEEVFISNMPRCRERW